MRDTPPNAIDRPDVISCATGILMERYGCDAEGAIDRLVAWSRETDIGIPLVAAWLIDDVSAVWRRVMPMPTTEETTCPI
ncbi:ANTAR domain-containing protein [Actinomycetospora succinea]|uniref:ANTAR domain-containing protein n=1 Tax=Actinomycetospora succinea TaxID=663603 RepID=A0A4R6VJ32_9PSEU|nr:ANTAR domain-containing protein [Actinomycetospora succinea]TDQ62836.1 ANTAR domain-containing protein [Actinomycetospora succinea]